MPTPKQTISFLKSRFADAGIHLRTQHGQNFLIDLNLLRLLAELADVGPRDVVLEVGTGLGSLTALLAPRAAAIVSVEIDRRLHQLASEELIQFDNVTLLARDALAGKNHLDPEMLAAVEEKLAAAQQIGGDGPHFKLVANLPYSVATPVIANLLQLDRPPESMTVTIQRELAERIVASPGTKDYGSLSVWVQSQCEVELARLIPPEAFWPRPKVHSAIVRIRLSESKRSRIADRAAWRRFTRALFLHRRKTLRAALVGSFADLDKPAVDALLERLALPPATRAEQMSVEALLALCDAAQRANSNSSPGDGKRF